MLILFLLVFGPCQAAETQLELIDVIAGSVMGQQTPDLAIDGLTDTYYLSDGLPGEPAWLIIELAYQASVTKVKVVNG